MKRESRNFSISISRKSFIPLSSAQPDALIKDKRHLLIVPSGPLTALPFHLLVTQKPDGSTKDSALFGKYRDASYLVKRQAITILPSVSSLKALRMSAHEGQATKPLIGFGDPRF